MVAGTDKRSDERAVPQKFAICWKTGHRHRCSGDWSTPVKSCLERSRQWNANQLLHETLAAAETRLRTLQGDDPAKWSWGALHLVRFRHSLDKTAGAEALTDPTPIPRPGDEYTVNATGYFGNSFDQVSGASYREILDTSDWDKSVAVNTPGQSGQPGSSHYSDLLPFWTMGSTSLSHTRARQWRKHQRIGWN